ncbi:MAG: methionyl-tRNA formyltransferase [Candidatus Margulisiibacteriota bacterium]
MRILLFSVTEIGASVLAFLLGEKHQVCGLVFNCSNNFDIQEMKELAKPYKIPFWESNDLSDPKLIAAVKNTIKPDLILIASFDQLAPKSLYSLAGLAAINIHPSYLPDYRGFHPYFWPLANGEKQSGVSFHYLSEKFDQGDVIAQKKVVIEPGDTAGIIIDKQKKVALKILKNMLAEIERTGQKPKAVPQPAGNFVKAPKIKQRDFFIDWRWPTAKIIDRIRALNPHSPAFTFFRGELVGIYQARPAQTSTKAAAGAIIALEASGPVVKTGDGAVVLVVVLAGKRYLLSGNDFIANEKVKVAEKFGWEERIS